MQRLKVTYSIDLSGEKEDYLKHTFFCYDGKLHIRLKHYRKSQTLRGIEAKLSFLLTLLFNRELFESNADAVADDKQIYSGFNGGDELLFNKWCSMLSKNFEYQELIVELEKHLNTSLNDLELKILKVPNTKGFAQFGSIDAITTKIDIFDYIYYILFDDRITVELSEITPKKDIYQKFRRKEIKKESRRITKDLYVDENLW